MNVALEHFSRRLEVETDVSDVAAAMEAGEGDFVLLDARSRASSYPGHLPGAVPTPELTADTVAQLPGGLVVTYCWGPSCNGACKAALRLAQLGRQGQGELGRFGDRAWGGDPGRA